MKKLLVWLLVAAVLIVVGVMAFGNKDQTDTGTQGEDTEDVTGAFTGFGSMRCEYSDASTGVKNTVLVKDGKAKIISEAEGTTAYIVYKDDEVYVWTNLTGSQGFIYTTADLESAQSNTGVFSKAQFEKELQKQNSDCKEATIADSEFTLPADIKFQSVSSLLKK